MFSLVKSAEAKLFNLLVYWYNPRRKRFFPLILSCHQQKHCHHSISLKFFLFFCLYNSLLSLVLMDRQKQIFLLLFLSIYLHIYLFVKVKNKKKEENEENFSDRLKQFFYFHFFCFFSFFFSRFNITVLILSSRRRNT